MYLQIIELLMKWKSLESIKKNIRNNVEIFLLLSQDASNWYWFSVKLSSLQPPHTWEASLDIKLSLLTLSLLPLLFKSLSTGFSIFFFFLSFFSSFFINSSA